MGETLTVNLAAKPASAAAQFRVPVRVGLVVCSRSADAQSRLHLLIQCVWNFLDLAGQSDLTSLFFL